MAKTLKLWKYWRPKNVGPTSDVNFFSIHQWRDLNEITRSPCWVRWFLPVATVRGVRNADCFLLTLNRTVFSVVLTETVKKKRSGFCISDRNFKRYHNISPPGLCYSFIKILWKHTSQFSTETRRYAVHHIRCLSLKQHTKLRYFPHIMKGRYVLWGCINWAREVVWMYLVIWAPLGRVVSGWQGHRRVSVGHLCGGCGVTWCSSSHGSSSAADVSRRSRLSHVLYFVQVMSMVLQGGFCNLLRKQASNTCWRTLIMLITVTVLAGVT